MRTADDFEAELAAIKGQAGFYVTYDDGGVVDPEKEAARRVLPFRISFARRKTDQRQYVIFWITTVKGLNAAGIFVPLRQGLRSSGHMPDFVSEQLRVGFFHIAYYNGDVLKPMIEAAGIGRNGASLLAEVFGQRDAFIPKFKRCDSHPDSSHAQQSVLVSSARVCNGNQLKGQGIGEEIQLRPEIIHGHPYRCDFADGAKRTRNREREKG